MSFPLGSEPMKRKRNEVFPVFVAPINQFTVSVKDRISERLVTLPLDRG